MTPDGNKLLFLSNRPGGRGLGDFYIAYRQNTQDDLAWDNIQPVTELNTSSEEFGPSGFEDPVTGQLILYFNSDRPGGLGASDIYVSQLGSNGKFTAPQLVREVSSASFDAWPVVRSDGLEMALISNRSGTMGANDIWISERGSLTDTWSAPVNLGPTVNTSSGEGRAWLYAGGRRIIFFSNRAGGTGGNDLYETTRGRSSVVPIVGSVTGVGGTVFRTSVQLSNPTAGPITGVLIFRPAGQQSAPSDPRISYALAPFETRTISDLMASLGVAGLGSLEIVPASGAAPAVNARIEDGGIQVVPELRTEDVLVAGSRGVLTTPSDISRFRFNIAVRTLAAGVTMTVAVYDAAGTVVRTATRSWPANYSILMSAADFTGGAIAANQTILISIDSGAAAVLGSTVSNFGQAPTLQIATRGI